MASYFTECDIIWEMVESGSVFWEAVNDGDISQLKRHLESGRFDVNKDDSHGRTALHILSCRGHLEAVKLLLEHGADVSKGDKHDNTPLHWCGHIEVIELLVENGADLFARNSIGATPKDMAIRRGINKSVIDTYNDLEKHKEYATHSREQTNISYVKDSLLPSLFHEFSRELTTKQMILLIIGIFAFSLYLTYIITGSARTIEYIVPTHSHVHHSKH